MNMLEIAFTHIKIGLLNELQYRVNFFIQLLQSLIALATGLIGLALVFSHTSTLGGWSRPELLAVMGIHILMGGVIRSSIQPNMERMMNDIQMGTFDFALTKPVDAQMLISVREFRLWSMVDIIMGLIVLVSAFLQMNKRVNLLETLTFLATLAMGAIMVYCFWLIVTSSAFWIIRVNEIANLFEGLYAAGRWPVGIYPGWLRTGLTFLVPVAFAITVPAEALTGRLTPATLLEAIALTVLFCLLARFIWKKGVKNYAGASA
jgi:ABC-2 type transport system permease protein